MAVVRLPDGKLLLISPIAADPDLVREVEALGPVAHLVAPNRFHHLFLASWQQACSDASTWVAPGLDSKRADLPVTGVLSNEPEPDWKDTLDQVVLEGIPMLNEVVFFHRPSATLLATDLAFNVGAESPMPTRLAFRLIGADGRLSPTIFERLLVRDREAFRRSLTRVLDWPFERVVVAHGGICERGGREDLRRGYAWVLDRGRPAD